MSRVEWQRFSGLASPGINAACQRETALPGYPDRPKPSRSQHPIDATWHEHFTRRFKDVRPWENALFRSSFRDHDRLSQLFSDCFGPHTNVRYAPYDEGTLHLQDDDPKRIIRADNLTAYFQYKFFSGAEGYSHAPIYETPNFLESESDAFDEEVRFEHLYKSVTSVPFAPEDASSSSLGDNRITFLIGQVGVGKTFMISQLVRRIAEERLDSAGLTLLPVYIDFEAFVSANRDIATVPSELIRRFTLHLHHAIGLSVSEFAPELANQTPPLEPLEAGLDAGGVNLKIRDAARLLAKNVSPPARLVVFVDNLDTLHYQRSRYLFFPAEYDKHREYVEDTIAALIMQFVDPVELGNAGLCVCIAARDNVSRDIRRMNHGAQPRAVNLSDHTVFQVGALDPKEIVQARLNLMEEAVKAYAASHPKIKDAATALAVLRVRMVDSVARTNVSDGLRRISALAHHGARSLVTFLAKLSLDPLTQRDVIERLFGHSPWLLERIYIANGRLRYSQAQDHFPNLFLVDGMISERVIRDVRHRHTYWLKYLLLECIACDEGYGVSVEDILEGFVDELAFEEDIVRLALGSLAMVNESRCVEIVGAARDECKDNVVRLTERGKLLVGRHPAHRGPYCFEWSYLQMVIDDYQLSLPDFIAPEIAVDASLRFAFQGGSEYSGAMTSDLRARLPATLKFVRVLEAAWREECRIRQGLEDSAWGPDFEYIYDNLAGAIERVAVQAGIEARRYTDLIDTLRRDDRYDVAAREYSTAFEAASRSARGGGAG